MKLTTTFLISLAIILLTSACSTTVIHGLSPQEIQKTPIVMVATSDLKCSLGAGRSLSVAKGTQFSVEQMGGIDYMILSSAGLWGDAFALLTGSNTYQFSENSLLLKWSENTPGTGFIILPNGEFAYEEYIVANYNPAGGNWWMVEGECRFDNEFPFELRDKR
jgi:hypothetical protein